MDFNSKDFEAKIGFRLIRNLLMEKCETRMGREMAEDMSFSFNYIEIEKRLNCVWEMKKLLSSPSTLPHDAVYDIVPFLKSVLTPGTFITGEQSLGLLKTLVTMKELGEFISGYKEFEIPFLKEQLKDLPLFPDLEKEIERCVDREGMIKDSASPELREIRQSIETVSKSMHRIVSRILQTGIGQGLIDKDTSPSLRDGHIVIPVSAANRREIPGILHDTSGTGKTVFIEPAEVVEAGNRLKELKKEEEEEIIRILISLTDLIRPNIPEIEIGCRHLALYDFIRAKARIALETDGELPVLEKTPEIDWFHAVHPGFLITLRKQGRDVVPLYIQLTGTDRILIISGPNAGGKSVSLKTVGAVQYMMQCGMLPTLHSNSHMGVFKKIFIDIGDQQSMENDLSTYSSHLTNMKYFLKNSDSSTLVLIDEIGSGTEPQIGAALSQAVLEELSKSGCYGIITTHYQNLKIFAENHEGFVNGAMTYDRQHLKPTFQLTIGEPGSSFALDIARNIGLPTTVIENAKEIVGTGYVNSEKFLAEIQRDRKYWRNKRLGIKEKESRLDKLLEEYETTADELRGKRNEILKAAKEEAKEIVSGANRRIEQSISEIRRIQAEKEKSKAIRQDLKEFQDSLQEENNIRVTGDPIKSLRHKSKKKREIDSEKIKERKLDKIELKIGDYVRMDNGGLEGKILSLDPEKAEVAFGNMRTIVALSRLSPLKKPKLTQKKTLSSESISNGEDSRGRQLNFKQEIDVRGMRADEALQAITYFMDDAVQFDARRVRILHGTGHGILRDVIRRQLLSNPNVDKFRDEDVRLGGAGITVVDLK